MYLKKSRCLPTALCACEAQGPPRLFHHFASGTRETRLSADPDKGMAGRSVQAVIDVIDRIYGGDPSRMPYVVNKEAFS